MGLYCFRGSILYRWRSVMSTVLFSALWKRLIWETQSSSLVTPRDTASARRHTYTFPPCGEVARTGSSWVYLFGFFFCCDFVCMWSVVDKCTKSLLPCARCRRTEPSWICPSAAARWRRVWTMLPCRGCLASVGRKENHREPVKKLWRSSGSLAVAPIKVRWGWRRRAPVLYPLPCIKAINVI